MSKLTEGKIREILQMYSTGDYTQQELADLHDLNRMTILRVVNRRSWKHVIL